MYNIFCNNHTVSLVSLPDKETIYNPSKREIYDLIQQLLLTQGSKKIRFQYENVNVLWDKFRQTFKNIKAAGGVVCSPQSEYLLIHRLGYWDLPKGKVEPNESIFTAAKREVVEECGLDGRLLNVMSAPSSETYHIYKHPYSEELVLKTTYWFKMDYFGNLSLTPQKEENIEDARWISPADIEQYKQKSYLSLEPVFALCL